VTGKFTKQPSWQAGVYDPTNGFTMWIRKADGTYGSRSRKVDPEPDPPPQPTFGTGSTRSAVGVSTTRQRSGTSLVAATPRRPVIGDYDGDKISDAAVYSPDSGLWTVQTSKGVRIVQQWGSPGDVPVAADYDADGVTDFAVWRPSTGEWWILSATKQTRTVQWGTNGDVPVPAK
jgi:hypothetical protein